MIAIYEGKAKLWIQNPKKEGVAMNVVVGHSRESLEGIEDALQL